MDDLKNSFLSSEVRISDRGFIAVTGVEEILSCDENAVILSVSGTRTVIEGERLRVTELSLEEGKVTAVGKINAVVYEEEIKTSKGFFSGLFKS